jgi:membrane protein YdbS with pleckstrin-like domain
MNLVWLLVIVLIVFAVIGAPGGYWHHGYGYWPSGLGGLIVLVLVILLLTGRL